MSGFFSRSPRAALPLLPIAPAIVVVVGITTAMVMAVLGISQLQATGDDAATLRAVGVTAAFAAIVFVAGTFKTRWDEGT